MSFLRSIESMGSYWEEALFPSWINRNKDLDEVKFLDADTDLPIVQELKEIRAKDILPHVMNRPLGDIISKEYLQTKPNLTLQDIVKFIIDITYLETITYVMDCHNKDILQNLTPENILQEIRRKNPSTGTAVSPNEDLSNNEEALLSTWINRNKDLDEVKFLLANAHLPLVQKFSDISGENIIQRVSGKPLKEYYPDLNEILVLTLQDIVKFMIDITYPKLLEILNEIIIKYLKKNPPNEDLSKDPNKDLSKDSTGNAVSPNEDLSNNSIETAVSDTSDKRGWHCLRSHYTIVTVLCIKSILTMVYFIVDWRNWTAYTFSAILITLTLLYALIMIGLMNLKGSNSIKVKQTSQVESQTVEAIISLNYCTAFFLQFKIIFAGILLGKLSLQYGLIDKFPVWAMVDIFSDYILSYSVACCVMTNMKEFGDISLILKKDDDKIIQDNQKSSKAAAAAIM